MSRLPATTLSDPSTAAQCPLCGQANQCAVAAGLPPAQCWCMQASLDPAALARIPAAQRGTACICPACGQTPASAAPAAPHTPDTPV